MKVSKRKLKALIEEPILLGIFDRYIQEGIVYLARHLIENDGKLIFDYVPRNQVKKSEG